MKRREMFTTTIPTETKTALKNYSDETMIPMSKLVEKAILEYMQNHSKVN